MTYAIDPRKVAGVVKEAGQAIADKGFNHGEVIVGLSELLGRMVVDVGSHRVQMEEMEKVVHDHLRTTIRVGAAATGKGF